MKYENQKFIKCFLICHAIWNNIYIIVKRCALSRERYDLFCEFMAQRIGGFLKCFNRAATQHVAHDLDSTYTVTVVVASGFAY